MPTIPQTISQTDARRLAVQLEDGTVLDVLEPEEWHVIVVTAGDEATLSLAMLDQVYLIGRVHRSSARGEAARLHAVLRRGHLAAIDPARGSGIA